MQRRLCRRQGFAEHFVQPMSRQPEAMRLPDAASGGQDLVQVRASQRGDHHGRDVREMRIDALRLGEERLRIASPRGYAIPLVDDQQESPAPLPDQARDPRVLIGNAFGGEQVAA